MPEETKSDWQIPREVKVWFFPCCGKRATGGNYDIDDGRAKCTKKIHRRSARAVAYVVKEPMEITR